MPKKIIIVGGNSGAVLAKTLNAKLPDAQITLINPRPYAVTLPTAPRMTVTPDNDLLDTGLIPFNKLFSNKNGTFVEGLVEIIKPNEKVVVLADGKEFPYDALVLAPGSVWEGPVNFPEDPKEVHAHVKSWRGQFEKAQRIVLVGGGAVGLEFAGEIKDTWPKKEVTIVHGDTQVLNSTYPAGFRKALADDLSKRGVNVVVNDYVDEIPAAGPATVTTRRGSTIEADLVVPTRGPRPRTEFVARSLGDTTLDQRKQIKVKPTLQLLDHPEIFAMGDVINYVEQKTAMKASAHGGVVAGNIVALFAGKSLKPYKGSVEMIVVTNGKSLFVSASFLAEYSPRQERRTRVHRDAMGHHLRSLVCAYDEVQDTHGWDDARVLWALIGFSLKRYEGLQPPKLGQA
ncbi:hypothetical protein FB45DRAFT_917584 [Roridomyces roridus]|uniref:FAD/NAD(P)-binding domain-containing protein n=1 Tax=Roridomyces roridus TaxID=1738132 RepID=A0AAD7BUQ2_9AGAR|nr:hypothetical protein FB45DRAFT_917584 [Roridomyces roridus]